MEFRFYTLYSHGILPLVAAGKGLANLSMYSSSHSEQEILFSLVLYIFCYNIAFVNSRR